MLPDPTETSGGLHPRKLIPGIYKFRRKAWDTEINVEEPGGNSFLFEHFELEKFLTQIFRVPEHVRTRLMDMIYNFLRINWDTKTNRLWSFEEPTSEQDESP